MLMRANQIHLSVASDGTVYATPVSKAGALSAVSGEEYPGLNYWGDPVEFDSIEEFLREAKLEKQLDDGSYNLPVDKHLAELAAKYTSIRLAKQTRKEAQRKMGVADISNDWRRLSLQESVELMEALGNYLGLRGLEDDTT